VLDCSGRVVEIGSPPDSGQLDALASSASPLIETPRGIPKIAELPIGGSAPSALTSGRPPTSTLGGWAPPSRATPHSTSS
jgi:hypothetical protein